MSRKDIESEFAALVAVIGPAQEVYRRRVGRYAQCLPTRVGKPDFDRDLRDQPAAWGELLLGHKKDISGRVSYRIDVYQSPEGHGYTVTAITVDEAGKHWTKTVNFGPETGRDADWAVVPAELRRQSGAW